MIFDQASPLRIMFLNVRSLRSRVSEIHHMASQRPSVICLAETHLDSPVFGDSCPVVADLQSALPLYTLFNFPHTRRSGGILVAVLSSIHAIVLPEFCIPPAGRCSSHVVSLNLFPTGSAPVRLITVYRQPGDPLTRYRSAVLPILSLAAATVLPTISSVISMPVQTLGTLIEEVTKLVVRFVAGRTACALPMLMSSLRVVPQRSVTIVFSTYAGSLRQHLL